MAVLITARMVDESDSQVHYEYTIEGLPPGTIGIDRTTGALIDADPQDRAVGKIYMKIKRQWEASGEFPPDATFAS
jgi:hypothetical protein